MKHSVRLSADRFAAVLCLYYVIARQTERGTRADDKRSETAMEDRKKEGYF